MILLTDEQRARLLANGRDHGADHVPVVKLLNPLGQGVWLATELDEDGDMLYGPADFEEPEIGSFSLAQMTALEFHWGFGIERDILFTGDYPHLSDAFRCAEVPTPALYSGIAGSARQSGSMAM